MVQIVAQLRALLELGRRVRVMSGVGVIRVIGGARSAAALFARAEVDARALASSVAGCFGALALAAGGVRVEKQDRLVVVDHLHVAALQGGRESEANVGRVRVRLLAAPDDRVDESV